MQSEREELCLIASSYLMSPVRPESYIEAPYQIFQRPLVQDRVSLFPCSYTSHQDNFEVGKFPSPEDARKQTLLSKVALNNHCVTEK